MKKTVILILLLLFPCMGYTLEVPPLHGHVNDYAALLSSTTVQELEQRLSDFEQSDSTQIAVLIIPTLSGENLEEFSIKVAENWKIGQKGDDNGVVLLIVNDEHKIRIEVGRGLEGMLTDLVSGRIIRNEIAPSFKRGDFNGGVAAGVAALMAVIKGEYKAAPRDLRHGKKSAHPIFTLALFVGVAAVFLGAISKILGGIAAAVGLPLIAFLTFPGLSLLVLLALGVAGFFLGLLLTFLFGSGGGFFGGPFIGGGFGGGSFGSGGFSGGGGDFGGGGASGDW